MTTNISAVFEHGAFIPETPCDIPEGTRVRLAVDLSSASEESQLIEPQVNDPEERRRILAEVVRSMREHPLPDDAPRFTREQLHERR